MGIKTSYPKVLLTISGKQLFVRVEEIIYLEAKGSYTDIHLKDERTMRISKKLKVALEILPADLFIRVHHSFVINLHYLASVNTPEGNNIRLKNGQVVPLSRSRKAEFFKLFIRL